MTVSRVAEHKQSGWVRADKEMHMGAADLNSQEVLCAPLGVQRVSRYACLEEWLHTPHSCTPTQLHTHTVLTQKAHSHTVLTALLRTVRI